MIRLFEILRGANPEPFAKPLRAVTECIVTEAERRCKLGASFDAFASGADVVGDDQVAIVGRKFGEAALQACIAQFDLSEFGVLVVRRRRRLCEEKFVARGLECGRPPLSFEPNHPRDAVREHRDVIDVMAGVEPPRDAIERFINRRIRFGYLMPAKELQQRTSQPLVFFPGRGGIGVQAGEEAFERFTSEFPPSGDAELRSRIAGQAHDAYLSLREWRGLTRV